VSPESIERILVIRRHNHIGDMLCSLPLYAALHARWPGASITLLATPTRYPIPLGELNPYIDEVIYYAKGTLAGVVGTHRSLRARRFDMAIVPSTVALSRTSHITARLSGARLRVGLRSVDGERNAMHHMLNVKGDVEWARRRTHQEERNRDIAALAGCPISEEALRALRIPASAGSDEAAARVLGEWADGRPLIGVHPGAGKPANVWPPERFAEVLTDLSRSGAGGVIVTAGALDDSEVRIMTAALAEKGVEHLILRQLALPVLAAVLRRLRLYLVNDTGTMHIAAYSGCPTVSLFGPTAAWEWAPRGERHRAVQSDDGSMEGIGVSRVSDACRSLL
jgi:ADP-heptose:LPS heptosyltransferase